MEREKTILVVDDVLENIEIVEELLADEFRIVSARSGSSALDLVHAHPPDLILLDIVMPGMDGYEVCSRLKGNPDTEDIPVIFLTGRSDAESVVKGLQLGAVDYVTKPFDGSIMQARVRNVVEATRYQNRFDRLLRKTSFDSHQGELLLAAAKTATSIQPRIRQSRIEIPSRLAYVKRLVDYLSGCYYPLYKSKRLNPFKLNVCVIEALNNAILHGNLAIPSRLKNSSWKRFADLVRKRETLPDYAERSATLCYQIGSRQLKISVEDKGAGFDPAALPDLGNPDALHVGGRGLLLIRAFMDRVYWNATGNKITMVKRFESA